jgi:hypothetical protein
LTYRAISSLVLALLVLVITAGGVSAKLSATLSTDQAQPGDIVTLTTAPNSEGVSQGGQRVQVYLLAGATDPDNLSCQRAGATLLGSLSWDLASGIGTLAFKVPDVPPGSHFIEVLAPNAYPGCWPEAMLTIVAAAPPATDAAEPAPAADLWWLVVVAAAGVAAVVGGIWPRRRTPASRRSPSRHRSLPHGR